MLNCFSSKVKNVFPHKLFSAKSTYYSSKNLFKVINVMNIIKMPKRKYINSNSL